MSLRVPSPFLCKAVPESQLPRTLRADMRAVSREKRPLWAGASCIIRPTKPITRESMAHEACEAAN
jgi:hypothetical protein